VGNNLSLAVATFAIALLRECLPLPLEHGRRRHQRVDLVPELPLLVHARPELGPERVAAADAPCLAAEERNRLVLRGDDRHPRDDVQYHQHGRDRGRQSHGELPPQHRRGVALRAASGLALGMLIRKAALAFVSSRISSFARSFSEAGLNRLLLRFVVRKKLALWGCFWFVVGGWRRGLTTIEAILGP
jgi:hypothetical protein